MRIAKILGTTALVAVLGLAAGCGGEDNPEAGTTPSAPDTMTTSPALPPATSSAPTPTQGSSSPSASSSTASTSSAPTSSAPPVDIGQPPTTYVQAQAHVQAARSDGSTSSLSRFSTPGDSIYCVLKSKYLAPSCELRSGAIKDPQVCAKAPSQFVGRVSIRKSGAEPECNTDTIRQPGADTVQPTTLVTSGNISCVVEQIGVTCIDSSLHKGFFLTPGAYKVF
ncbi:hypothetical protein [Nocardioides panacisoli]|uniref:Uncharacterized protein n=1 Tax=Nocardioides panacisoli TaxID=627624 RepID=A0ABP7J3W4_9ACTN